jgi:hypothetical protein
MVHHDGRRPEFSAAGFELVSFQFFQKCPNIDLTLTSCLAEIENKFQYGALSIAKTVTVTVTPLISTLLVKHMVTSWFLTKLSSKIYNMM